MAKRYETELILRPAKQRRRERVAGIVGLTLAASLASLAVLPKFDGDAAFALLFYPGILGAVSLALLWKSSRSTEQIPTPAAVAAKEQDDAASAERGKLFWNRWYIRYLVATGCFGLVWYFLSEVDNIESTWVAYLWAAVFALIGTWKAREVALPVLGLGMLWMLIVSLGEVRLSVPGAIVLGAIIIALAIQNQRKS